MRNHWLTGLLLWIILVLAGCSSVSYNAPKDDIKHKAGLGSSIDALLSDAEDIEDTGAGIGAVADTMQPYTWDSIVKQLKEAQGVRDIEITTMQDNSLMIMIPADIAFGENQISHQVKESGYPTLHAIAQVLQQHASLRIKVVGHMDNTGSAIANQMLSVKRAKSVFNYLTEQGVNESRITIEGRGVNDPIASNETERGQLQNRRLEVFLYSVE